MSKTTLKKLLLRGVVLLLCLSLALTALAACGKTEPEKSSDESSMTSASSESEESSTMETMGRWDALQTTDEPITLLLIWGSAHPTVNTEPTEESPIVRKAATDLTAKWLEDKPNVTVNWSHEYQKNDEWIVINYTAGTGPDLFSLWGAEEYNKSGWYVALEEIVASPNYYEPGAPVWRDTFADYLWDPGTEIYSKSGKLIGLPVELGPGSLTAVAYNVELCRELGFAPTTDLDEYIDMCLKVKEETDYVPVMPHDAEISPTFTAWVAQFSLMPVYAKSVCLDVSDLDGDGIMSSEECLRACWNGGFYMQDHPAMYELYGELFRYFWSVYEDGAMDIDYTQAWRDGKVVFRDLGLFELPGVRSDTNINYEWALFVPPVKQNSEYVTAVEYTDGPFNPAFLTSFNLIEPSVQGRPAANLDYLVDWLKFMLTADNQSIQVEEAQGSYIGAIKGCRVPSALGDWFSLKFPQLPPQNRLGRPNWTDPTELEFRGMLDELLYQIITLDEFAVRHDELMYKSVQDFLETDEGAEYDVSDWGEQALPKSMR